LVSTTLTRIGGVFLLGTFALSVYIGLYDTNLSGSTIHYYVNWLFAAANLVAAIFLIGFPRNRVLVGLGGIIWPILYVLSLSVDVFTKMCLGEAANTCQPGRVASFDYLILGYSNIPNGYGWVLWQGTMPLMLGLMFVTFVISIATIYSIRKSSMKTPTPMAPATTSSGSMPSGSNGTPPNTST
jgi:hypothetical protein